MNIGMRMRILDDAAAELADAIDRYDRIEPGLGQRLEDEARGVLAWIAANPELPRKRSKGYRRVNFKLFPFYAAYLIWENVIWIIAVAHNARMPEYFIRRIR
jgi:hypothetical protein